MSFTRLISADVRSGLLVAVGTALLIAPVALGLGAAALVVGVVTAATAISLGLAGTSTSGRGTLPLTAHSAYDRVLGGSVLYAGLAFAAVGNLPAAALFAGVGLLVLAIGGATRYSAPRAA